MVWITVKMVKGRVAELRSSLESQPMHLILHSAEIFVRDLNGCGIKLTPVSMELWICTQTDKELSEDLWLSMYY